jgi:hypothetical protein
VVAALLALSTLRFVDAERRTARLSGLVSQGVYRGPDLAGLREALRREVARNEASPGLWRTRRELARAMGHASILLAVRGEPGRLAQAGAYLRAYQAMGRSDPYVRQTLNTLAERADHRVREQAPARGATEERRRER